MQEWIDEFLKQKRIAVVGVSRSADQPANLIYRKLKEQGREVWAVNPRTEEVEGGDDCYPSLVDLPAEVDAVVIATPPGAVLEIVRGCHALGVELVWMHRSFGEGSVSQEAIEFCRDHDIRVIGGGCPMMYLEPVDIGHRCMRWLLRLTGGLPKAA